MKKNRIRIDRTIPRLIEADDYHDFWDIQSNMQILDSTIRCVECGFIERAPPHSTYLGLIYHYGKKPSVKQVKNMIEGYEKECM